MAFSLHTWQLSTLEAPRSLPSSYEIRSGRRDELGDLVGVIAAALSSDHAWAPELGAVIGRLDRRLRETLGTRDCDYLVATSRGEPVAVSGLANRHASGQNLLTGVCVHPRHQKRGLGTGLLSHSLNRLRAMGANAAWVYTVEGSIADRYLYPHFDSVRIGGVRCRTSVEDAPRLMRGWLRFG